MTWQTCMCYHIKKLINTTGDTCVAGSIFHSGATEVTPNSLWNLCCSVLCFVYCYLSVYLFFPMTYSFECLIGIVSGLFKEKSVCKSPIYASFESRHWYRIDRMILHSLTVITEIFICKIWMIFWQLLFILYISDLTSYWIVICFSIIKSPSESVWDVFVYDTLFMVKLFFGLYK